MSREESFLKDIAEGYAIQGDAIVLGAAMLDGEPVADALVQIPLKMFNRHGLIAGATGTGKTKTLQILSEHLSSQGIPVLQMDIKGDLSGIAKPGEASDFIKDRHEKIGLPYESQGAPVELMTISDQDGVRLRATISEFGPVLLSRILDLNDTQAGVMAVVFKYCDDNHFPLLDLKDLKKTLQYITNEGKKEIEKEYGRISAASTGAILRKLIELEQQGAELFFGERSFEIEDLMRIDEQGRGYVNIIRLTDIQDRPKLFSTFMLSLLAEMYNTMPEQGDTDRPELVVFIDEAHLIFDEASKALLDQIESIVKLIRSKGVGLYFCTQLPTDVPDAVLSQLGLKIQHALRAFTAKDRKAIKLTAENYPVSNYYDTATALTSLGTGEALVTGLNEKGRLTPLAATMLRAPMSRMDVLTAGEISEIIAGSGLRKKYNEVIDRESAYEILDSKIEQAESKEAREQAAKEQEKAAKSASGRSSGRMNPWIKLFTSATFIRGVFGVLNKLTRDTSSYRGK